jgi:hypothetical protein
MLKQIPKSDISIRPFKAYKEWSFDEVSAPSSSIYIYSASFGNIVNDFKTATIINPNGDDITYYPHSIYGSIKSKFYTNVDNSFYRSGTKSNQPQSISGERYLGISAKVISIPQIIFGEGIKKGSIILTDNSTNITYIDNGSGSLVSSSVICGDVFYNDGIITYTKSGSINTTFTSSFDLYFKSTETIYENEYLLIVNESDFNVSTNPTAIVVINEETGSVQNTNDTFSAIRKNTITKTITNPGVKYIRKKSTLENGNTLDYRFGSSVNTAISGGFEHYDLSGSVDSTGSFLTPFITTIGLYDDNCELVAVAKLPKPIKSEPDIPVNFIVRFDT